MTSLPFRFDEIGYWSQLKLEIVEKYGAAYTNAFSRSPNLKKYYIDAFSGAGLHVAKTTGALVEGSPARALKIRPPFDGYHFIDLDAEKTDYLRSICGDRPDVDIHTGNANDYLVRTVLPSIQYRSFRRALCLLDPYGLDLDWEVIRSAGRSLVVDMFLNFPVMDMNRNAIWRDPDKVPKAGLERMNRFWGDESWKQAAYGKSPQADLFGTPIVKQNNDQVVAAFRERLMKVAGFKFVAEPLPMRNSTNAVVYYLFLASPKAVAQKIITDIFKKYS